MAEEGLNVMDLEKFTERSRGFLQAAQTSAQNSDHQRLEPIHLLKALVDDPEGLAANLVKGSWRRSLTSCATIPRPLSPNCRRWRAAAPDSFT